MNKLELQGSLRTTTGKGEGRRLRNDGFIPAVVYGNKENMMLSINNKEIVKLLKKTKANAVFNLKVDKVKDKIVVIKEIQRDVMTRNFLHVDLLEISMDKMLKINVPVQETGIAMGIKLGGILTHVLRELKVECLPTNIPESIKVDVSNLDVGQTLHVSDVEVPAGVTILNAPDDVVCALSLPEAEKSKEVEDAEAAAAAAAAAPAAAGGKEKAGDDKGKEKAGDDKGKAKGK